MNLPVPLRPFASRNYRVYWIGQLVSFVGTWMQQMAMGWVVTRLTDRAVVVGALTLTGALPMALLGLKGGQLADRVSRRNILLVTQALMAVLALCLAGLAVSGHLELPWIFGFSLLLGVAAAFDLPAANAFAPELVPAADIPRAVGLLQAVFHGSRLIGPALAGYAIARWGEASAFAANGVSFLAVILSLLSIPPSRPGAAAPAAARPRAGGIGVGLAFVREDPVLMRLLVLLVTAMTFAFPFLVSLMAYYARYVLHANAEELGRIMSTSGFGAACGSVLLVVLGSRAWRPRIGAGAVAITTGVLGLSFARTPLVATLFVGSVAIGTSLYMGTIMQVAQQRVPNELRGRVMAVFMMGITSVMPIVSVVLAALADLVTLERLLLACGAVFGVTSGALVLTLPREPAASGPNRETSELAVE